MKNTKLPHIIKIIWATLIIATLIARNWHGEAGTVGLILVCLAWTCIRIVSEGIISSLLLMQADEEE